MGKLLLGRFRSERTLRIQGWTFGTRRRAVAGDVALA
jgi:hypothetical protein